jgi:hypothetical protein
MKVIGAGFGRTGTTSLQAALETLGFGPCYHMNRVFERPADIPLWLAAAEGRPVDWDRILGTFGSGVDFPVQHFHRELLAHYPDARVILTVRDPEAWWRSTRETIYAISQDVPTRWVGPHLPVMGGVFRLTRIYWNGVFGGRFLDKAHAIGVYHRYCAEVQATVPPERLLVYDLKQGWEPLCSFLGVPVPETPLPHLNDTAEFRRRVIGMKAMSWAVLLAPILAGMALLWWR